MTDSKHGWMFIILVAVAVAILVAPAAARIGYSTVQKGDTIFIHEKHLDITGLSGEGTVTRLVHYADLEAGSIDDFIPVIDASDFSVLSPVGFPGATYYAWDTSGLIDVTDYVVIDMPEITLDIVSGITLVDKLTNMTIIRGTPVTFQIVSNVPAGFNLDTSPPYVELLFTTPERSQILAFGGVSYNLIHLTNVDFYVSETGDFPVSDTTNVERGLWTVQARWLNTGEFTSFYGEGVDSNIVTFTIASTLTIPPATVTTALTTVPPAITTTATPVPTTMTTVPPATTATPTTSVPSTTAPGFDAMITFIGLGAIALLVLRRL